MNRQFANLRAPVPRVFVDGEQQLAFEQLVGRAREAQRVPFAIAPRQAFRLPSGRLLGAGDEIRVEDFTYSPELGPGWRQLEKLIAKGIVLEWLRGPSGPEAA